MTSKPVLYNIKIATGIAIIIVVIGHLASRGEKDLVAYVNLKEVIYKFHMPLFIFLSGYIASYTFSPIENWKTYFVFVRKKFNRLMPAYFLLSTVFLFGKMLLSEKATFQLEDLMDIFINPSNGNSGFLWYIYILFFYYVFIPPIMYIVKDNFRFLFTFILTLLISIYLTPFSLFSIDLFLFYLPFFILGCYLSLHEKVFLQNLKKYGAYLLLLFLLWLACEFLEVLNIQKHFIGFLGIFSVLYLSSFLIVRSRLLEIFGDNSFYIYLYNTMFMGGITVVVIKVLGKSFYLDYFYFLAPILISTGIILPILFQKYIFSKIPFIRNWIR